MGELQIPGKLARVLSDVAAERVAQDALWGVQEFPDGTGPAGVPAADRARQMLSGRRIRLVSGVWLDRVPPVPPSDAIRKPSGL